MAPSAADRDTVKKATYQLAEEQLHRHPQPVSRQLLQPEVGHVLQRTELLILHVLTAVTIAAT